MNQKMFITDFKALKYLRKLVKKSKKYHLGIDLAKKKDYSVTNSVTIKNIRDAVKWATIDPLSGIEEINWNFPRDDDDDESD